MKEDVQGSLARLPEDGGPELGASGTTDCAAGGRLHAHSTTDRPREVQTRRQQKASNARPCFANIPHLPVHHQIHPPKHSPVQSRTLRDRNNTHIAPIHANEREITASTGDQRHIYGRPSRSCQAGHLQHVQRGQRPPQQCSSGLRLELCASSTNIRQLPPHASPAAVSNPLHKNDQARHYRHKLQRGV